MPLLIGDPAVAATLEQFARKPLSKGPSIASLMVKNPTHGSSLGRRSAVLARGALEVATEGST